MKKFKANIITTLFLILPAALSAQNSENAYGIKFSEIVNEAYSKGVFSGNVLIVSDGKVAFETSIGNADYDKNIPNTVPGCREGSSAFHSLSQSIHRLCFLDYAVHPDSLLPSKNRRNRMCDQ